MDLTNWNFIMVYKKPRYFTAQEFKEAYPSLSSDLFRPDLYYVEPFLSPTLILQEIEYKNMQDQIINEKYGSGEDIPLDEVFSHGELLGLSNH